MTIMDDMNENEFLPKLSQNLLEILNDDEYYDITIEVGNEPYIKIFRSHAIILYYRSSYLQRILSTNKKKNDGTLTHIKLPNISPEIFQIILRYIYGGKLSLEEHDTTDIVKTLVAANELNLQDLIPHLQSLLIKSKANWMEQNFDFVYQTSFENDSFSELQKYCTDLISNEPDKLFNSLNFSSIPEKLLVTLIQSDNLQMNEIQVWEHMLKWGLAQNPELPSDPEDFSKEDFNILKNSLQPCIPSVRFYNLTSEEFSDKVLPYKKILPKELYKDLLKYFLNPNNQSIKQSKPRMTKETSQGATSIQTEIKSFEFYKMEAEKGNVAAQTNLGNLYASGRETNQDLEKAIYWWEKAAENGSKEAQYNLGRCYKIGVKKDEAKAFEYYKKSADQKHLNAQFELGCCYNNGIGTEIDKTKAFELYKIAAEKEHIIAQNNLGFLYENGEGTKKDLKQAIHWYNKAAENGNNEAQYNLGRCYRHEIGVKKDEVKAFEYYKKSADQGYLDAQFELRYCYNIGIGTEIDKTKSFELYKIAAEKGEIVAQNNLGIFYENGEGTEKDLNQAVYWYNKAAENGYSAAQYNLGQCYKYEKGVKKDEVKAFGYFKKSAENGYQKAQSVVKNWKYD